jgi:signal transduction histidine kinase
MSSFANAKKAKLAGLGRWLRLNLMLLAFVLLVSVSFPVSTLSQKLNDLHFRMRRPQPTSRQVALVLVDDASLAHYGRWPWSRSLLAQLIRSVSRQQPKAIGLDILLSEPEDETNDAALARAIREAPHVVLASKISSSPENRLWVDPLPRFSSAAGGVGHVQSSIDFDGLCRSIPVEEPSIDGLRPAFALKLAEQVNPRLAALEQAPAAGAGIQRQEPRLLIVDYRQQFEPGQAHPPFVAVSAGDLLSGAAHEGLAGKVVLIGFGGIEVSDRLFTPVSDQMPMPGVEINANVADMLLSGRKLTRIGLLGQLLLVAVASALSLWVVACNPGARGLLLLAGIMITGYFAAYFLFVDFHRLISYGPVLVAGLLAAPIAQLENLLMVDREVTLRLQHLRYTIKQPAHPAKAPAATLERLHWKLTALKELQAELSSLYTFNRTLLETMREGLAVYAADGTLRFSNATWKNFCERQKIALDDLAGLSALTGGHPHLAAKARDGNTWVESEVPVGEELWLFRAVPLPWTSFADAGAILVIAEDVTARLQRDQARSEALSFVTHELRTPLIAIQGFSELLMRYPDSPASSEAQSTIFRESNRLVAMINTYLEVLRLDAGARSLRLVKTNMRTMVEHVKKVVQPLAAAARIQVNVEVKSADENIVCDETLIAGALLNLVSNAIKYSVKDSEVRLRVSSFENEVEFEVHNSGPAIPPGELEHVFDRFYRLSRNESMPGWGLGLSFVRRICQQHGGRVQASSNEISGTSFAFVLPRGACEASEVSQ